MTGSQTKHNLIETKIEVKITDLGKRDKDPIKVFYSTLGTERLRLIMIN